MKRTMLSAKSGGYKLALALVMVVAILFAGEQAFASTHAASKKTVHTASKNTHSNSSHSKSEPVFHFPNLPTIKGGFGQAPSIAFPKNAAPANLISKVLIQGSGPKVTKGSLLVANYIGQIWQGKVFDSSFARHVPSAFPIGIGQVIPGWDKTLVGLKTGTRIMLVIPPKDGYGPKGQPSAGITGKDTLVFVVDVIAFYANGIHASSGAKSVASTVNGVKISGPVTKSPSIQFLKGNKSPSKLSITVIDRGNGPKVKSGLIIMEYVAAPWNTTQRQSSWTKGQLPLDATVGIPGQTNEFGPLLGMPLGSRVLLQVPKIKTSPAFAVILDLVAQPKGAYYS